jgi:phosphatidylinositol-3-phosphatase
MRFARLAYVVGLGIAGAAACVTMAVADDNSHPKLDRVFIIMMENQGFDQAIGQLVPGSNAEVINQTLLTPFTTNLAYTQGLATFYFGVTHPSLPNYLATIAGDFFGVNDDNDSCFATYPPLPASLPCHGFPNTTTTIVDQLEANNITWEALVETAPSVGYLGRRYPASGPTLYAQKHNPFVYFNNIVANSARLAKIKPFDLNAFKMELSNPSQMAKYVYIVPNQCNDQHGTSGATPDCSTEALALAAGDLFLQNTVTAITSSPSFTKNSAIFIVWDENDFSGQLSCCTLPQSPSVAVGGGHATAIVVTKNGKPRKSATPTNHYSLLATIEDGFNLPRLRNAQNADTLWNLFPESDD